MLFLGLWSEFANHVSRWAVNACDDAPRGADGQALEPSPLRPTQAFGLWPAWEAAATRHLAHVMNSNVKVEVDKEEKERIL